MDYDQELPLSGLNWLILIIRKNIFCLNMVFNLNLNGLLRPIVAIFILLFWEEGYIGMINNPIPLSITHREAGIC